MNDIETSQSGCCESSSCCTPSNLNRRQFIKATALTSASLLAGRLPVMAGPFNSDDFSNIVPPNKKLSKEWIESLYARGKPMTATGDDLRFIGMPINGICTGQVYLGGDGKLWHWNLDSHADSKNQGWGPRYMDPDTPYSPIHQGFAIRIDEKIYPLERDGFKDITFTSHYPMAEVAYRDESCPVSVDLHAYTPFIPLNRDESSYPVVVLHYTLKNNSSQEKEVSIAGWVENYCMPLMEDSMFARRHCTYREFEGLSSVEHSIRVKGPVTTETQSEVFANFEGEGFGDWKVEGKAFGLGPVQPVSDRRNWPSAFEGKGIAYSNTGGDEARGKLVSPEFTISKPFLNFLLGGGRYEETSVRLIINGQTMRTASGVHSFVMKGVSWNVESLKGQRAHIEIVDDHTGQHGHVSADHFEFSEHPWNFANLTSQPEFGSVALSLLGTDRPELVNLELQDPMSAFHQRPGSLQSGAVSEERQASIGRTLILQPGEEKTVSFAVSWHFPNNSETVRNHYATLWPDAGHAAAELVSKEPALRQSTQSWMDTWYDSTLPYWFLERTFVTLNSIQTQTTQRYINEDGLEYYNFEEGVKCCPGNCTHVWQYAHGLARIFPEIERECRDKVEYGLAFQDSGLIYYRYQGGRHADALDGQCGTILRVLRESQMTSDTTFLEKLWLRTRKSMEYVIKKWDEDEDGILAGPQHNTLDAAWHGEVPWHINIYHAALRAAAVMARQMNEDRLARRYDAIVDRGVPQVVKHLWREDYGYFIHKRDPNFPDAHGSDEGCHIDQVLGDSWLWNIGLERILPKEKITTALDSLWKYNFVPDVGLFRKTYTGGRWYAATGDAGLIMCSYPFGSSRERKNVESFAGYLNECMTGFEWQVASHMIWEGMLEKGLAIGKAINDRYQPNLRNPYNEIECSDHYARAMASYSAYMAVCGYRYDGPNGSLAFGPRMQQDNFRAAFTAAEGWGRFTQKVEGGKQRNVMAIHYGKLQINELVLDIAPGVRASDVVAKVDGQRISTKMIKEKNRILIRFRRGITIGSGQQLEIEYA